MPSTPTFVGTGQLHRGPWQRTEGGALVTDLLAQDHPAYYEADPGLVAAVNTAMILGKPLLVTGNPGTGKSELAERIAWELQLGAVLRFESQSLSEVGDLFYRYDLVGRLAQARLSDYPGANIDAADAALDPVNFIEIAALGKAILRAGASPERGEPQRAAWFDKLRASTPGLDEEQPSQSVVLIDEIDKASRDFPNDLLNGLARMEFRIKELDNLLVKAPHTDEERPPIVIITSNLERDLPDPFLRRCVFYNIPDPTPERMAHIVSLRVFPNRDDDGLPPLYKGLLDFFVAYRRDHEHVYTPGTSELIDAMTALERRSVDSTSTLSQNKEVVRSVMASLAKHRDDAERLDSALGRWSPA